MNGDDRARTERKDEEEALRMLFDGDGGAHRPDDGFTERVMAQLPKPRRRPRRTALVGASCCAAVVTLFLVLPRIMGLLARGFATAAPLSAVVAAAAIVLVMIGAGVVTSHPD